MTNKQKSSDKKKQKTLKKNAIKPKGRQASTPKDMREKIVSKALEDPQIMKKVEKLGINRAEGKKLMEKSVDKSGPAPKKIEIKHVPTKYKKPSMFGKISGFFSESEEEKKTRLIEKNNLKKELGAEESVLMSNNSPFIFALMWLISEKRV
jgi:hypothetical protein